MQTEDLVTALARQARPVRRLPSPVRRTVDWLAVSGLYAAVVIHYMGLRPDILVKLADSRFVVELGAALVTASLAAVAAFCAGTPGRPIWQRLAPMPALAIWLASLGQGCWQSWIRSGPSGLEIWPDPICFPSIVLAGAVPGALILWMIRKGAPMAPITTTALASLAAAALGAAALRLFHPQDASVMILVWQVGSVAVLTMLGAASGRFFLRWTTGSARHGTAQGR